MLSTADLSDIPRTTNHDDVADIRLKLANHESLCYKPGTCGACMYFNAKIYYGWNDPNAGKCYGWLEDDAANDLEHLSVPRWTTSIDTCPRYQENTTLLLERDEQREKTGKALLQIKKRNL